MHNTGKPKSASLPTLYPSRAELNLQESANVKFLALYDKGVFGSSNIDKEKVFSYIGLTASQYIKMHRLVDYPADEYYSRRADSISNPAKSLIAEVEKEPSDDLWWISSEFSKRLKFPLQTNVFAAEQLSVVSILQQLAALSDDFAKIVRDHPGVKERQELEYLVGQLAKLWLLVMGRKFSKSLTIHKTGEFTSPAVHFVHEMARAFDPDVTAA